LKKSSKIARRVPSGMGPNSKDITMAVLRKPEAHECSAWLKETSSSFISAEIPAQTNWWRIGISKIIDIVKFPSPLFKTAPPV
jgi:hypothetical protein